MKTHALIYQINYKMNRKYSHDIEKVRNNVFLFETFMLFFKLVPQRKASFIASLTSITVFSCAHIKMVFKGFLPLRWSSKAITQCTIRTLEMGLYTPL